MNTNFNISLFNNKLDNIAKPQYLNLQALFSLLSTPDIRNDKDGRLISGAIFTDNKRSKKNAIESSLLILDFDHVETIELAWLNQLAVSYAFYTTFSHGTPDKPCAYRVVILLHKPIPANKYPLLFQWAFDITNQKIDAACKDISRMQYLPACPTDRKHLFQHGSCIGTPLDWEKVIDALDKPNLSSQTTATIPTQARAKTKPQKQYVSQIIDSEISSVTNAANGSRNHTLNKAAFALGTLAASTWANVNQNEIESLLLDAAHANGLVKDKGESATRATIKSGLEKGLLQPRQMPENKTKLAVKLNETRGRPKKDWESELKALVEQRNSTHAQVMIGGKHRIMLKVDALNSINKRATYEFIAQPELEKMYQNTSIKISEEINKNTGEIKSKYANHIKAWATNDDCRLYRRGVVFKPFSKKEDDISNDYFNTWQGYTVTPKQGDWTLIKSHIDEVVCGASYELSEYIYNWIAYTLQHPEKPAGTALVLRGEKGTGKGILGNFLMKLWGNHAIHITNAAHLVGNFNGHFNDVCFVFADEAFFSGDRQHEGVLKGLITEPNIIVERKGIDAVQQPNYLKVFMATNSDWAVPASKDERRYCVVDVNSDRKGDYEYFKSLANDCNDAEIQAAFLHDMLNRDIRDFHTGQIPETIGLQEQRYHSLNSMGKWLVDCLERGYFISTVNGEWVNEVSSKDMYESYIEYCNKMKVSHYDMQSQKILSKYLKNFFKYKERTTIERTRGFDLGSLNDAIASVEAIEKIRIERHETD